MCKFFVNLVCCFIPSRHLRHIFREKYGPKKYYNIVGNNNVIYFGEKQTRFCRHGIDIMVIGDNNKIFLPDTNFFQNCQICIRANNAHISIGNPRAAVRDLIISMCAGNNQRLKIGDGFSCNGCRITLNEYDTAVNIGNNCLFSYSISLWPTDCHSVLDKKSNKIINKFSNAIEIGDHVWVGDGVKILKNVRIANDCIIGAGSLVCKSVNTTNVIIAGNPAVIVRKGITWDYLPPSMLAEQMGDKSQKHNAKL